MSENARKGIGGIPIGSSLDTPYLVPDNGGIGGIPIGKPLNTQNFSTKNIGIGGVLIGKATKDQRNPKQDVPCSDFMNILNKERTSNTEKWDNSESALNYENPIKFKSTDDIILILKSHPDFSKLPVDSLQPVIAAIASALAIGGGIALTVFTGGIAAVAAGDSIGAIIQLAAGTALTSAGSAGMQNAIKGGVKGSFTWKNWGQEVGVSTLVSVIIFPITLGSGLYVARSWSNSVDMSQYGNIIINAKQCKDGALAHAFLRNSIIQATTLVNATLQAGADSIQRVVKEGKVNIISLILSVAVGAWSGYNVGSKIAQGTVDSILKENLNKLTQFFDTYFDNKIKGADVSNIEQFFTEDMVDGLLQRCHDNGTGHAILKHGPNAQIMDRITDRINMASKFNEHKEMLASTHETIVKGGLAETRGVKLTFDYTLNRPINVTTGFLHDASNTIVEKTTEDYTGLVRTVVIFKPGELPQIKTSFPKENIHDLNSLPV